MSPKVVAWSDSDDVAFSRNRANGQKSEATRIQCFVEFAVWRHRERILPSPPASRLFCLRSQGLEVGLTRPPACRRCDVRLMAVYYRPKYSHTACFPALASDLVDLSIARARVIGLSAIDLYPCRLHPGKLSAVTYYLGAL